MHKDTTSTSFAAINKEKRFYDVESWDFINLKKRENSKHEFGIEYENTVPPEGEVRFLGNRHIDCRYYSLGLELCKERIIHSQHSDYTPCKAVVDSMYRCYTQEKHGDEYHQINEDAKPYMRSFFDCYFYKGTSLTYCMKHFEDSIRVIYRSEDNKLNDYF